MRKIATDVFRYTAAKIQGKGIEFFPAVLPEGYSLGKTNGERRYEDALNLFSDFFGFKITQGMVRDGVEDREAFLTEQGEFIYIQGKEFEPQQVMHGYIDRRVSIGGYQFMRITQDDSLILVDKYGKTPTIDGKRIYDISEKDSGYIVRLFSQWSGLKDKWVNYQQLRRYFEGCGVVVEETRQGIEKNI